MHRYKPIYKKASSKGGWIFEKSKNTPYECLWGDLYDYIIKNFFLKKKKILDIGTGEGLKFSALSPYILSGIGIDAEPQMISLAGKYKITKDFDNLQFFAMNSKKIRFPDEFFNIITCRHAPFSLTEVYRLLKSHGIFITQQIHERDKQNLKELFQRGQNFNQASYGYLKQIIRLAKKIGFTKITHQFSNLDYYFNSKDHLIDYLESSPVIPDFDPEKEKTLVDKFVKANFVKGKGIKSNSARFLVIMVK